MNNILPCPFCGSKAVFQLDADHHGEFFELGCPDENCTGHWAYYTEEIANRDKAIAAWNTRATAPAPGVIHKLQHDEPEWFGRMPTDEELEEESTPAPASGWMEEATAEICEKARDGTLDFSIPTEDLCIVAILMGHAPPAPDVAKLEAELAELKAKSEAAIKSEERCVEFCVGLSLTDPQQLPLKLLKSSEKIAMLKWQEEQDRILKMTLATQCDSCRDKLAASEAENARLRALLKKVHDKMLNWFSSEYAAHPDTQEVTAALAASPAPSAWREMDSAPKDGREVLLLIPLSLDPKARTVRRVGFYRDGEWHDPDDTEYNPWCDPLGWQPLPEPPAR